MITAVAVILGLIAGGLLVALRRLAHRARLQRQQLSNHLRETQTALETSRRREAASLDASSEARQTIEALEGSLAATRDQIADLDEEIEAADALANDQSAELASMAIENEELRRRIASTELDLLSARRDLERLEAERPAPTTAGSLDGHSPDAEALWRLELARSERTWLHSVAILPDDPSPFGDSDDPLRLAIETEASALRDDVGAFLTVEVEPHLSDDPATAHLVLRVAQELLAQAARLDEPSHLSVLRTPSGAIALAMRPVEVGDVLQLDLTALALTGEVDIDLTSTDLGTHTVTLGAR